jgi:hypothetical protein
MHGYRVPAGELSHTPVTGLKVGTVATGSCDTSHNRVPPTSRAQSPSEQQV